jgi:pimeloyl-ACP methyl ester carboxylesterase
MHEDIGFFGKGNRLVGVLSHPDDQAKLIKRPAIIILNAGLIHRVGPFRFHADLARLLAGNGFYVLRFDLSGLGDSAPNSGSENYETYTVTDTGEAMTFVTSKTQITTFVLMGLCSGSDIIHAIATIDRRIRGGILIDAYGFPNREFHRHAKYQRFAHLAKAMATPGKWMPFLRRIVHLSNASNATSSVNPAALDIFGRNWPTQQQIESDILAMVERGVKLLYIYTGGVSDYFNHKSQFNEMFPLVAATGKVTVEHFPKAGHTHYILRHREKLRNCICSWLQEHIDTPTVSAEHKQ